MTDPWAVLAFFASAAISSVVTVKVAKARLRKQLA